MTLFMSSYLVTLYMILLQTSLHLRLFWQNTSLLPIGVFCLRSTHRSVYTHVRPNLADNFHLFALMSRTNASRSKCFIWCQRQRNNANIHAWHDVKLLKNWNLWRLLSQKHYFLHHDLTWADSNSYVNIFMRLPPKEKLAMNALHV